MANGKLEVCGVSSVRVVVLRLVLCSLATSGLLNACGQTSKDGPNPTPQGGSGGSGAAGMGGSGGSAPRTGGNPGTSGTAGNGGEVSTAGAPGSGGNGGEDTGGRSGEGGAFGQGGSTGGGGTAGAGSDSGGEGGSDTGGRAGGAGTGGVATVMPGPCDLYREAGQPCVAAYSTVRRLSSAYTGPLYQVRSGSSAENTGSGGETHDIGQTADGFADAAAVDAVCADTICTVSLLYDQSGKGSHLSVAKKGIQFGGPNAATDDFESSATAESLSVAGHDVYPLYMEARQGYRLPRVGEDVPSNDEPLGIYLLADGTRAGVGCCWDFGVAPRNAQTFYDTTALLLGTGVGVSGAGDGPWFLTDLHTLISAGNPSGSTMNANNPSLKVKFALGFLKTQWTDPMGNYALRMADASTADTVTTAYQGSMPRRTWNGGGVILGVSADNSNASWGTFYEGAIVAGYPADETEQAVLRNVQALGYGR